MPIENPSRSSQKESLIFACVAGAMVLALITAGLAMNKDRDNAPIGLSASNMNACPGCGQWGAPVCSYCRSGMAWNQGQNCYACPRCRMQGIPYCPSCMRPCPMQYNKGMIACVPPSQYYPPQAGGLQQAA